MARGRHRRYSLVDAVRACAVIDGKCVMNSPGKRSLRLGRGLALAASSLVEEEREGGATLVRRHTGQPRCEGENDEAMGSSGDSQRLKYGLESGLD